MENFTNKTPEQIGKERREHKLWLQTEARYEYDTLTWYNLIAQFELSDPNTNVMTTPDEVWGRGWEDEIGK